MSKISIVAFTRRGILQALDIEHELRNTHAMFYGFLDSDDEYPEVTCTGPKRYADEFNIEAFENLDDWTKAAFADSRALIFVSAAGIAVRSIAPYINNKFVDPAVISLDEAGMFVVPLLSGHVGGANELARYVASITNGEAVISTSTDINGRFAVDVWACNHNMEIVERDLAKKVSAALLADEEVGFVSDFPVEGLLPDGLTAQPASLGICVSLNTSSHPFEETLHLVPRILSVGVGCRRGVDPLILDNAITSALGDGLPSIEAVSTIASIDVKQDEPALNFVARQHNWSKRFYTAEQLREAQGVFTPSEFVESAVGVDNVCERACVLASRNGELIVPKMAGSGVTVAVAVSPFTVEFNEK